MNLKRSLVAAVSAAILCASPAASQSHTRWKIHDMTRPVPAKVEASVKLPVPPPSDAVVLFDGSDLSSWRAADGSAAKWIIKEGSLAAVPGGGAVQTRDGYGDIQLHIEWAAPTPGHGKGQGRGNSGVFLMGKYEIQVLDSHENTTYPDGQAAAVYGQYPPLVNASLPAGEWQSYDIFFTAPRFADDGSLTAPAHMTVVHNGVLVHNDVELAGPTRFIGEPSYEAHPLEQPLQIQDHANPVSFRNIWIRELQR